MAPSKLRKAIGAVKDHTSIGLAKVGSSASLADLDVAIVKATRHEEYPPDERHVREILNLTSYSRAFVGSCVRTIARRLNKTSNWVVALKTLMLVQRLLAEGDPAYEQEIFFATRRGTRLLNMSDFRDASGKSYSWDYSAFVRTYALYLDEQLEYRMQGRRGKHSGFTQHPPEDDEPVGDGAGLTPFHEMRTESLCAKVHRLLQVLDRFLACKPTGAARDNRVVSVALYPIVKESFLLYYEIMEVLGVLIERFMELELSLMVRLHEIFSRAAKQLDELDAFYAWSKSTGLCRSSEYPDVEKISVKKLDMMDDYIRERSMAARMPLPEPESDPEPEPDEEEDDMNAIKALPPPEEEETKEEEVVEVVEAAKEELKKGQDEGDLLNLGSDIPTTEEHGDRLALALFNGAPSAATDTRLPPWEAFKDSSCNWETALVMHGSHLPNQKASLPGGFDTLILDGMYRQGAVSQAVMASGMPATGSASSVALGSAGRPSLLALPAPPSAGDPTIITDPFAASLPIPPPAYVQMSDLEKKQKLLVDEQMMWQNYQQDGMRGQVGLAKVQQQIPYQYSAGGYMGGH